MHGMWKWGYCVVGTRKSVKLIARQGLVRFQLTPNTIVFGI